MALLQQCELAEEPHTGLLASGTVMLSISYALAQMVGIAECNSDGWRYDERSCEQFGALFAPVVGPFVALGTGDFSPGPSGAPVGEWYQVAFVIDGVLQAGGALLAVAGLLFPQQEQVLTARAGSSLVPNLTVASGSLLLEWKH